MIRRAFLSVALLTTFVVSGVGCQPAATRLTSEQRQVLIDSIASALNAGYVFPDVAARMDSDLRARAKRGEYNEASDVSSFAQQLTRDLQAISHDKHLRVRLRAADPMMGPAGSRGARSNVFGRTERMAGDVAYVEILSFGAPPEEVQEATTRIMSAAADAKALIIDLRANGGGSPFTVALVSSYLFGADAVHLNSLYSGRPIELTISSPTRSSRAASSDRTSRSTF